MISTSVFAIFVKFITLKVRKALSKRNNHAISRAIVYITQCKRKLL